MYRTQQTRTRKVTLSAILSRAAFRKGFEDRRAGRAWDDTIRDPREQWSYERGRLFGCVFSGRLKQGRTVTREALGAYADACQANLII